MNDPRVRAVPFQMTRAEGGDGLTLEGYAAVFDETVRIWDPWDGEYDERFSRNAFAKTLKERTPYLMLQHGRHPLIGSLPIGSISELAADSRGLHVRARLHDNWLVEPVRDAIASGSISGMSIMFEPVKDTRDDSGDTLLVTRDEVKLLELGPVVFPAYESTEVGVRSIHELNDLRNLHPDARKYPLMVDAGIDPMAKGITIASGTFPSYAEQGRAVVDAIKAFEKRVITKQDLDGDAPEAPADPPATSQEAAPEGTSEGAGTPDPERSVPPEVLALAARNAARRYPSQGA